LFEHQRYGRAFAFWLLAWIEDNYSGLWPLNCAGPRTHRRGWQSQGAAAAGGLCIPWFTGEGRQQMV